MRHATNSPTASLRAGFTLIELMTVVLVISILASTILFAMYGAVQEAKEARTKTQIARVNDLIMSKWESFRTRPIRMTMSGQMRNSAEGTAKARLYALRELMRLELPDRKTDVLDNPVLISVTYVADPMNNPTMSTTDQVRITRPAASREYLRRANAAIASSTGWTEEFQDAECLYLILASIREHGTSGLDFFHENEIGDRDGDGMNEVWDAWGNPIAFIRWPSGFLAHPGLDFTSGTGDDIPSYSNLQEVVLAANGALDDSVYDPFDPLRVDARAPVPMQSGSSENYYFNFATFPLISSAGPDEVQDIVRYDFNPSTPGTLIPFDYYRNGSNPNGPQNDPYSIMPNSSRRLGEPFLESHGYRDNITNHLVEIK